MFLFMLPLAAVFAAGDIGQQVLNGGMARMPDAIATLANEINHGVENIGARRLHTVMEKLLEDISFTATDKAGTDLVVDESFVQANIGDLVSSADLSKFIL